MDAHLCTMNVVVKRKLDFLKLKWNRGLYGVLKNRDVHASLARLVIFVSLLRFRDE